MNISHCRIGFASSVPQEIENPALTCYDGRKTGFEPRDPHLWEGDEFGPRGPAQSLACCCVHPVSSWVHSVRPCSRAVYDRCSPATKPAAIYAACTASRWWLVSGSGSLDRAPDAIFVVLKGVAPRGAQSK